MSSYFVFNIEFRIDNPKEQTYKWISPKSDFRDFLSNINLKNVFDDHLSPIEVDPDYIAGRIMDEDYTLETINEFIQVVPFYPSDKTVELKYIPLIHKIKIKDLVETHIDSLIDPSIAELPIYNISGLREVVIPVKENDFELFKRLYPLMEKQFEYFYSQILNENQVVMTTDSGKVLEAKDAFEDWIFNEETFSWKKIEKWCSYESHPELPEGGIYKLFRLPENPYIVYYKDQTQDYGLIGDLNLQVVIPKDPDKYIHFTGVRQISSKQFDYVISQMEEYVKKGEARVKRYPEEEEELAISRGDLRSLEFIKEFISVYKDYIFMRSNYKRVVSDFRIIYNIV